jgi:hypothetical protein
MDQRDTLHGWDVYFSRSTDYGQTFAANYPINDTVTTGSTPQDYPSMYYKNDMIHASWHDGRDGYAVYSAVSTNNGLSFGTNVRVADDANARGYYSSISVDDSANVYIAWSDYRDFSTYGHEIYFAFSADSGQTFEENVLVNDHQGIINAWDWDPSICVNDSGKVFVAWSSTRNDPSFTNFDIYCATGTYVGIEEYRRSQVVTHVHCYPNPFHQIMAISFQSSVTGIPIDIKIYDTAGRLVKLYSVSSAEFSIPWDGRDENGKAVPAGVYFIQLGSSSTNVTKKVVKIE